MKQTTFNTQKLISKKVVLRPKKTEDAIKDYLWRKDKELSRLDAIPPINVPFNLFLKSFTEELNSLVKERFVYAIDTLQGIHIGNCMYYNIDELQGDVEIGIVIGEYEYHDKGHGTDAVKLLLGLLFQDDRFHRIHLKTLENNIRAQKCFLKCGFTPCGELYNYGYFFQIMEIYRDSWSTLRNEEEK